MAGDITRYGRQYLRKYFVCKAQRKKYLNYIDYETISQYYFFDLVSFAKKFVKLSRLWIKLFTEKLFYA